MKKITARTLTILLLACLVAACQPKNYRSTFSQAPLIEKTAEQQIVVDTTGQVSIGLILKTQTNPYFAEMEKGARRAETDLNVHLIVKTIARETSFDQQIEHVQQMIDEKVDAIVITPADSSRLISILKKAQDAGIVLINVDDRLDPALVEQAGMEPIPFISVNNHQGAYLSTRAISAGINEPTQAAILEGIETAQNAIDRKNGSLQAFRENPNIRVVASQTAHWKIDEAYSVTRQILTDYPDVRLIFCANDMMALGSIQFLQETQRTDVQVASFDALAEALNAMRAGTLAATIDQQAAEQGYLGIQYALKAINGQEIPAETLIDVKLITQKDLP